jgi:hypothetical protein
MRDQQSIVLTEENIANESPWRNPPPITNQNNSPEEYQNTHHKIHKNINQQSIKMST